MSQIAIKTIGQGELRELARTEPWRAYWGASGKQNIFEGTNLISFSINFVLFAHY